MSSDTSPLATPTANPPDGVAAKLRVFISYSRVDGVFAEMVRDALVAQGYTARLDKTDIVPSEDWRKRLDGLILDVEAVLFIISPDSVARWDAPPPQESVCAWEIRRTVELHKRLIPVIFRRIAGMTVPSELSQRDYVDAHALGAGYGDVATAFKAWRYARDHGEAEAILAPMTEQHTQAAALFRASAADPLAAVIRQLDTALNVGTVLWERELTSWQARAESWAGTSLDQQAGKLLPIGELGDIQAWARLRPASAPIVPAIVDTFIQKSAEKLEADDIKQRRLIGRAFVQPAYEALVRGEHDRALRLSAAGVLLIGDLGTKLVPELYTPTAHSIFEGRARTVLVNASRHPELGARFGPDGARAMPASFSPDGAFIVTSAGDPHSTSDTGNTAHLWDAMTGRAVASLIGHDGVVHSASFSADGHFIVTASEDKTARVWETITGKELVRLEGHSRSLVAASFSSDGCRILTASSDNTSRIWDAISGQSINSLTGHERPLTCASFSPDGTQILTASFDNTTRIWSAVTWQEIATFNGYIASFSPDGSLIASASADRTVRVRDAATGQEVAVCNGHTGRVNSVSFSLDGTQLVTGSSDKTARIWVAATGMELTQLVGHSSFVNSASFSSDGGRVLTGSEDSTACLWDAKAGQRIASLKGHARRVLSASFNPAGTRVLTASVDRTARVWDAASGREIATLSGHSDTVEGTSFSVDGDHIATASKDKTIRVWDVATGREIAVLTGHEDTVWSGTFSPDGNSIVSASADSNMRLWEATTGRELIVLRGHQASVNSASFNLDGTQIVSASSDTTARIWDAESGNVAAVLQGHSARVNGAWFSPDGTRIVSASSDKTARIWKVSTGMEIAVLAGHAGNVYSASFSPNGALIATASDDNTACVWDAATGHRVAFLSGHTDTVMRAMFSPDSNRIATASHDNTARLWEAATGQALTILQGHEGRVNSVSFSPDGARIVTASLDNTARIWDVKTGREIAAVQGHGDVLWSASFSPDGRKIVTTSEDNTAHLWDVSRTTAIAGSGAISLTAALALGVGLRTSSEATDLLMQEAPDDLFAEALRQTGLHVDDPDLIAAIDALHEPLHPNCYLSPTQFAEMFGLGMPHVADVIVQQRPTVLTDKATSKLTALVAPPNISEVVSAPPPPRPKRPRVGKYDQRPEIDKHVGADTTLRALASKQDPRLQAYEDANHDAMKAQDQYKGWGRVALVLMTFATIISASMLFPIEKHWPDSRAYQGFVSGLQSAANAIALVVIWWLSSSGAVGRWMSSRAEAERLRGDYFRALLLLPAPEGAGTLHSWRGKLGLFEAAHLDYQRKFFASAFRRHSKGASSRSWPRAIATTATVLGIAVGAAALVAGFKVATPDWLWWLGFVLEDPLRWQLGFNTAASALLAYASARAMITQDERNAALYAVTMKKLDKLRTKERLDAVRAAADAGNGEAVLAYAREAQAILDADYQAWTLNRPPADPTVPPPERFRV